MPGTKIFDEIANKSDEHEFYNNIPKGYVPGKTKFMVISGSVISGVGKGTFSASVGTLLKLYHGFNVSPIKLEGYLNYDSGTLNPFRHGEVFVLDDGTECDLDLGSYERMLGSNLCRDNFLTAGRLFKTIIDKEREGKYLGRDVQFIPHVTGELKNFLRSLAMKTEADFVLIEVGGTVGDIENSYYLEAMRELRFEEGKENVCFASVVYILEPGSLGEQKSKAAQLGLRTLMSIGIQPDIIVCRSEHPVSEKIKEKISISSNVPVSRIINLFDTKDIYSIPIYLKSIGLDEKILETVRLSSKGSPTKDVDKWVRLDELCKSRREKKIIGIAGKYTNVFDSYMSIIKALEHTSPYMGINPELRWIETSEITRQNVAEKLEGLDGIIVPGGFGSRGIEGKIECARYARENGVPYLGLCLGFQIATLEFARNVCGIKDANSTEFDPKTKEPVIDILPEQKKLEGLGGTMRLGGKDVQIKKGTNAFRLYGKELVRERFRHRYECNPEYIETLERHGMVFSGKHPKYQIMQILELPKHPFFMATQYHAEFTSKPLAPNPMFYGFLEAVKNKS